MPVREVVEARAVNNELIHVVSSEGRAFRVPGDRYTFLVTGTGSREACFIVHRIVPPGGGPPRIQGRED
ncbi:hypothetical protein [Aureimonas leprariae]|uniref:Uncharacterized protein n=1 Tax=Plantimonas leprariae TaxID=2615207 RepID=A0A7V7PKM2_9HYPH|nr:hypothetical protein [Aureimonas leprariae]KAB0676284.1 hypothetical protein F6X38_21500 [Aureimonas leprariae]